MSEHTGIRPLQLHRIPGTTTINRGLLSWIPRSGRGISEEPPQDLFLPDPGKDLIAFKPAVYLYPTRITPVRVYIDPRVELTIDIPAYFSGSGWYVLAYPNGTLVDLQPDLSDEHRIEGFGKRYGMGYAREASRSGVYPYLYWEGKPATPYQYNPKGWLVSKKHAESFLIDKLERMGFNESELQDFISYWTPKLAEQTSNYFKLSFMFTQEFDREHPMLVLPRPDNVFRVMLQVEPILDWAQALAWQLKPQQLPTISRSGFTVVEWGGYLVYRRYPEQIILPNQAHTTQFLS